jgi:uncharacterized protein YprB with RNaseH-like and TPR domain
MIQRTFVFLKGIGESTERRLWDHGIGDWSAFRSRTALPGIAPGRKILYDEDLASASDHLRRGNARYFSGRLKPRDHWRLFEAFGERAVFLDIETTGAPPASGEATVVGLYARGVMTSLVRHSSLTEERLREELSRADLLVTFCGSIFDIPYLRAKFPRVPLDHPHIDLCFAAKRVGLRGGLKHIESLLDIERPEEVRGLDGWDAVRLWQASRRGSRDALELLLRYNEADTRNLLPLARIVYSRLARRYGPAGADDGPMPPA